MTCTFWTLLCIVKPPRCLVSDWIKSFKINVFLKCAANNLFITGFYRLNPPDNTSDPISLLEQAKCCSSIPEFSSQHGTCINADWRNSLAKWVFSIHIVFLTSGLMCGVHVFTICIVEDQQNAYAQMYALQRKTLSEVDVQTFLIEFKV